MALLVALAALAAVFVPATLALGEHGSFDGELPNGVVVLSMGSGPTADKITYSENASVEQKITTAKNSCIAVNASLNSGPLLVVSPGGTGVSLGEAKDQIGVKSAADGSGENCVRTGVGEILNIKLGASPALKSNVMGGFDLDIQLKFDSMVVARTYRNDVLQDTLNFAGEGLSDNGPDSEDNFRWAHVATAGKEFDRIELRAQAGTFSIGGGRNIDEAGMFDTTKKGSQFALGPIFDGQITCGDSADIGVAGIDTTYGTVTMHAFDADASTTELDEWELEPNCELKPYFSDTDVARIAFRPVLENTRARYTLEVTVENQPITTYTGSDITIPPGTITSLIAEYNTSGVIFPSFVPSGPVPACQGDPTAQPSSFTWAQDGDLKVENSAGSMVTLLPPKTGGGLAAICFYEASVSPTGAGVGTEHWAFYFEDDPGLNFR